MTSLVQHDSSSQRVHLFDTLRGISVVSMVLFHYCYDYKFLAGNTLSWFAFPIQDIWRASISWTFLFIAGCMCSYSRNNFKRSCIYGSVAVLLYVVTSLASVDTPISFGIIFCMALSTFIYALLEKLSIKPYGYKPAIFLFVLFVVFYNIPNGTIGIGSIQFELPKALYATPYFSWMGFMGPGFSSSDYYPLLPFSFMYFAGASFGALFKSNNTLYTALSNMRLEPFTWIGKHALAIYVLHQPIILLFLQLI